MKRFRAAFAVLLALVLAGTVVAMPVRGLADAGDFSSNTDFDFGDTSWDSGGSSWDFGDTSWDSGGSSWDWDSSSSSSRSSSGSSFSSLGTLVSLFSIGGMPLVIVVLVVAHLLSKAGKRGRSHRSTPYRSSRSSSRPVSAPSVSTRRGEPIGTYTNVDAAFDAAALEQHLSNLYVQMQNAWTAKDLSPVRPYFTPALYAQMERQLAQLSSSGRTNYVERISVMGVVPQTWYQEGGFDHIVVRLQTRIVDYTVDDATQAVVSGSKTAERFMTYEWDVSRESGITTQAQAEKRVTECPNCGAPLNINATAKCPYCDSVIEVRHADWALSSIKAIKQQTR